MTPNPFYMKRILRIIATQKTIIMRLPYNVTETLALNFHNFNPRASMWVDRAYKEALFKLFPESFFKTSKKLHEILLRIFRVRVLPRKTLLLEEGTIAREIVIILRGDVDLYRRLPNQPQPVAIQEQKIPLDLNNNNKNEDQEETNEELTELARGFFKLSKKPNNE